MNQAVVWMVRLLGPALLLPGAATEAQTTVPASQAVVVAVDATTPQGALKMLSIAMRQGDEREMRTLMLIGSDEERKIVDAQIAQSRAFAAFRAAAVTTFGDAAANEITGDVAATGAQQMTRIDEAIVKADGDAAIVTMDADIYTLKKVGPDWKVSIGSLLRDSTPEVVDQIVRDMNEQTTVVQDTANEVLQGKYKSTDEVAVAFRAKAMKVQMDRAAASTNSVPATQPER